MTPNFKLALSILGLTFALLLSSCSNTLKVLDGASHACGIIHVEGYITDSQGDIKVIKTPEGWTPEQVEAFCP